MNQKNFKIGLFAIGLEAYWPQFDGLRKRLETNLNVVEAKLMAMHPDVINLGLVDNTDKAFDAGTRFRQECVDLIFIYVATYALSATVLPVVQQTRVPVIILNIVPEAAIDYETFNRIGERSKMTAEWLAYCSPCPVPELINVFKRTKIQFYQITGILYDDACWAAAGEWIEAGLVARTMAFNRMGCLGHYYSGMLDIYADLTLQYAYFGGHIELLEVDELAELRSSVSESEISKKLNDFQLHFDIEQDCNKDDLRISAQTSVALDKLVDKYQLGSMAYYYKGTGNLHNEETISSIILGNSLLTARNIPVAGEYEIKNVQAMKILDSFGAGGSFTEYYAIDYIADVLLMGHDGPGHIGISEGKTKVRPLKIYHGKVGRGLSVEMSVKIGSVTLLSVVEIPGGKLMLLLAEAESVPGPILQIGNTNSRYKFHIGVKAFIESWNSYGPAHHCAVGIGHIGSKIKKLGNLLNIDVVQIC